MLDIAFELIGEATSNSFLMFCFCNLIIVVILTGSSKPSSMDSQDSTFVTSVSYNMCDNASDNYDCGDDDEEMAFSSVSSAQDESLINDLSVSDEDVERGSSHCYDDDDDDDNDDDDDDDDDEDDNNDNDDDDDESKEAEVEEEVGDDDLRKRAEEFIAKINKEWRHEKLRALNLVY